MRHAACLAAVLLAAGCAGEEDAATKRPVVYVPLPPGAAAIYLMERHALAEEMGRYRQAEP